VTWAGLARRACVLAGVSASALAARPWASLPHAARRPAYSALHSEREILLPALDDALARYVLQRVRPDEHDWAGQAAHYSR
jgi:dTDP-4-dehydrorhamnose reductase